MAAHRKSDRRRVYLCAVGFRKRVVDRSVEVQADEPSANVSCRKQCQAKNATPQIEIMTNAIFKAPTHPRKQVNCLADMAKSDYKQTSCAH